MSDFSVVYGSVLELTFLKLLECLSPFSSDLTTRLVAVHLFIDTRNNLRR